MKRITYLSLIILTIAFGLAFSANAQSSKEQKSKVALDGYCPVAYHVLDKAVKGKPEYSSSYEGKTYNFVNAKAKKMFDKDPAKFLPAYDSYCATGMSMGKKLKVNPKLFTEYKGKTYLFSSKKAKAMFDKNPEKYIKKADKEFQKLKK